MQVRIPENPTVLLRVHLPDSYPSTSAPIAELAASHLSDDVVSWTVQQLLSQFQSGRPSTHTLLAAGFVTSHAHDVCMEPKSQARAVRDVCDPPAGEIVLYTWIEWLREQAELRPPAAKQHESPLELDQVLVAALRLEDDPQQCTEGTSLAPSAGYGRCTLQFHQPETHHRDGSATNQLICR